MSSCNQTEYQQMSLPGGFPASHTVLPGTEEAREMTATSGRRCYELYGKWSQLGLLVKMFAESSAWNSTKCFLIWKNLTTPANRLLFQLAPSMPRTEEKGSGLLPTPTARDYKYPNKKTRKERTGSSKGQALSELVGGPLNPEFCEYLMGYPSGWTDLNR